MNSIQQRILMVLLGTSLIPLIVVFLVSKTLTSRGLEHSERGKLAAVGREVARQIESTMSGVVHDLNALRSNPLIVGPDTPPEIRAEEMRRLVNAYSSFTDLTLYDADGMMILSTTGRHHPEPVDQTEWLKQARDEGIVRTSQPHRVLGQPGLNIKVYVPIYVGGEREPFVLKARLTFGPVWEIIDGVTVGQRGEIILLDSHGKILASRSKHLILEKFDERYPASTWQRQPNGFYANPEGARFAYSARAISPAKTLVDESWTLLSLLPEAELTAVLKNTERYQHAVAAGALLLAAFIGILLSRRLAAPVIQVSAAARKVAQGEMGFDLPVSGPREMKQLIRSFNTMTEEVRDTRARLESLVDNRTRKLRESQGDLEALTSQLRATYESTKEAILVVKPDGSIIAANRRMAEFFAIEEDIEIAKIPFETFQTRLDACFSDPEQTAPRWSFYQDSADGIGETEWNIAAPEPRTLCVYTAPVKNHRGKSFARLWMFRDVSEQRQLERGLQQAQKMEAVGRLAGGVAHDFNNLLTGIIGNLSLAEMETTANADGDSRRFIASAKKAGERAADLVKQLLGFSRRSHLQLAHCDLTEIVLEVQDLLKHTIDPRIQIKVDLPDVIWNVNADATQVEQVLMNMCVNATHALDGGGGRIAISTRNVHISEEQS
ncbi:MAG: HAMP domain-containing protein, partial [Verrucomicrobiales bacterium]